MALDWNTIHLFGFGQTQAIGKDFNKKFTSSTLTTLPALVAEIYAHKTPDYTGGNTYRVVTMLNGQFIDWCETPVWGSPAEGAPDIQTFRINISVIDQTILGNFITELSNLIPA